MARSETKKKKKGGRRRGADYDSDSGSASEYNESDSSRCSTPDSQTDTKCSVCSKEFHDEVSLQATDYKTAKITSIHRFRSKYFRI